MVFFSYPEAFFDDFVVNDFIFLEIVVDITHNSGISDVLQLGSDLKVSEQ